MLIATFFTKKGERQIGTLEGFFVGIAQALAIVPGISRSGATISTALFFGVIIPNLTWLINGLGENGLVGLIALSVIFYLFYRKKAVA